jgi:hypothetical protein
MEVFYKVVRKVQDGKFVSALSDSLPPDFVLTYKIGETTTKKKQSIGIFVFNDLQSARSFSEDYDWSQILVGEGSKCRNQCQYYCSRLSRIGDFYKFYLSGKIMRRYHISSSIPDHFPETTLLDEFTPTRVVTPKHLY